MYGVLILLLLLASPALAQAPTEQQLLGATIGNLFVENARLSVALQQAQAKLKELSDAQQKPSPSPLDGGSSALPSLRKEGGN